MRLSFVLLDSAVPDRLPLARSIATQLALPLVKEFPQDGDADQLILAVTDDRIEVRETAAKRPISVSADFLAATYERRLNSKSKRREPLLRAIDPHQTKPYVIDATAGWGHDAMVMAAHGCRLLAIERSPVMAILVRDGIRRALEKRDRKLFEIIEQIEWRCDDSLMVLKSLAEKQRPDVVYIDPMFPDRRRQVAVKKELHIARLLVGDDSDAGDLLLVARQAAQSRVVVKRHRRAAPIAPDVHHHYLSKLARFDVYEPMS